MRKLLLAALFIPVLMIGCSTDEENVSTSAKETNDRTPKALCVPVSGVNGINAQVVSKSRRLFFTWNDALEPNLSRYYEAEIQVRNGNCTTGEVSDIIDTYPIDIFGADNYAAHQLAGTCFNWRVELKGYKVTVDGNILACTTQTPWTSYAP